MPIYTSEVKDYEVEVQSAGTSSTINNKFVLAGGGHNAMVARSSTAFVFGTTGVNVPTGTDAYTLCLTNGTAKLNSGNSIAAGKTFVITFWGAVPSKASPPAGGLYNAGVGFSAVSEEPPEDVDELHLEEATNSDFDAGLKDVEVKWKKSSTSLDPKVFTDLAADGMIENTEFSAYSGGGTGDVPTTNLVLHAFKITVTAPSGGRFYRLKSDGGSATLDAKFLYDLKVTISDSNDNPELASTESMVFQIDKDSSNIGGTEKFSFIAGSAGTEVANIDESGNLQMDGDLTVTGDQITFGSGATVVNTDANTLTVTEANVAVAGNFSVSGDITGDTNTFTSANANDPLITIQNTANDATSARLKFNKNRGVDGADGDDIGDIQFWSYDDDAPNVQQYAGILAEISDASSGAEGGKLSFRVASHDGTVTPGLVIEDGSAAGELDVTIGAGAASLTTIAGGLTATGGLIGDTGIGTSSPASAQAASSLLHIHDTVRATIQLTTHPASNQINNGADIGSICFGGSEDGSNFRYAAARILGEADGAWSDLGGGSTVAKGQLSFWTADSGDEFDLPTARMTIKSDGKIGIGATDPGALLEVRGPVGTGVDTAGVLQLSTAETSVVDADQLGRIEFIAPKEAGGTDAILVGASIYAEADDTFAADNNETELVFATATSAAASERMRITSDGRVGINTSTPVATLEVGGSTQITGGIFTVKTSQYPDIYLKSGHDSADRHGALRCQKSRNTTSSPTLVQSGDLLGGVHFMGHDGSAFQFAAQIQGVVDGTAAAGDMPGRLEFLTTLDGGIGSSLRMTIKNDGKVGIGTATPSSALEVNGLVTATYYKVIPCGSDFADTNHSWLPFSDTHYADNTTTTHWSAYTFLAPCDGTLVKVKLRSESAAGSTTIKLYRITDDVGGSLPTPGAGGTTEIESEDVNIAAANTAYTATFSSANMSAGEIYGLAMNPTSTPNMVMVSAIITLDWSTV